MTPAPIHTRGAALLTAMLTVTLVATFAAAALWQQWRAAEIETAERARAQSAWMLAGALDWSRLILREDANAGGADHLSEPWAVPLEEARLSSFLAADRNVASGATEDLPNVFLSGRIVDAQSKLNVANLAGAGQSNASARQAFVKLFQILGLPAGEVDLLVNGIRQAGGADAQATSSASSAATGTSTGTATGPSGTGGTATSTAMTPVDTPSGNAPLMPQQLRQLTWFGLSPTTVAALDPYVTVLPRATPLNINTASAEALAASVPALDLASARRLVTQRMLRPFDSLPSANKEINESGAQFNEGQHSVASGFFEVYGRLRLDKTWVEERSLLRREGRNVWIVWRERGAGTLAASDKP